MNDSGRSSFGLIAALLAVLSAMVVPGVIGGGKSAPSRPASTPTTESPARPQPISPWGVDNPIYDYLGTISADPGTSKPKPAVEAPGVKEKSERGTKSVASQFAEGAGGVMGALIEGVPTPITEMTARDSLRKRGRVDALIMTVPDPMASAVGHQFDLRREVIEKALSSEGYSLSHFYLPWRVQADDSQQTREPGLMLFRKSTSRTEEQQGQKDVAVNKTDCLLVYLVAESPISGIERKSFERAVDRANFWMTNGTNNVPAESWRIVGPMFSGSADSLAQAVSSSNRLPKDLLVITPGATLINPNRFHELSGQKASIFSTRVSNDDCRKGVIDYLANHRLGADRKIRIAWLKESTSFIGAHSNRPRDTKKSRDVAGDSKKPSIEEQAEVTNFSFPMHVRRIGADYAKSKVVASLVADPGRPIDAKLDFDVVDNSRAKDIVPLFNRSQSNAAGEHELRNTLSAIRHGEFDVVAISATDTWDYLFLCEIIKEVCPDKQIVVVGASRAFTHPNFLRFMRGVITVSTYPPNLDLQRNSFPWGISQLLSDTTTTNTGPVAQQFAYTADSEGSIALHNALVLSLNHPKLDPKETPNTDSASNRQQCVVEVPTKDKSTRWPQLVGYGDPGQRQLSSGMSFRPGYYVSVVGASGFVPLYFKKVELKNDKLESTPLVRVRIGEVTNSPRTILPSDAGIPRSGLIFLLVLLLTSTAIALTFLLSSRFQRRVLLATSDSWRDRVWSVFDELHLMIAPLTAAPSADQPKSPVDGESEHANNAIPNATQHGEWLAQRHLAARFVMSLICFCTLAVISGALLLGLHNAPLQQLLDVIRVMVLILAPLTPCLIQACGFSLTASESQLDQPKRCSAIWLLLLMAAIVWCAWQHAFGTARDPELGSIFVWYLLPTALWGIELGRTLAMCSKQAINAVNPTNKSSDNLKSAIALLSIALTLFVSWIACRVGHLSTNSDPSPTLDGLLFEQLVDVTGGGSLLLSLTMLACVPLVWALAVFRRISLRVRSRPTPPWGLDASVSSLSDNSVDNPVAPGVDRLVATSLQIDRVLGRGCLPLRSNFRLTFVCVFAALAMWLAHVVNRTPCTYAPVSTTWVLWGVAAVALVLWTHTMCQLFFLRSLMSKLLVQMTWMPLLPVLLRLPERIRNLLGRFMDLRLLRPSHARVRVHYLNDLKKQTAAMQKQRKPLFPKHWPADEICDSQVVNDYADELPQAPDWQPKTNGQPMQETIRSLNSFGSAFWRCLVAHWGQEKPQTIYPTDLASLDTTKSATSTPQDELLRGAEEFVGIQFVSYWHSIVNYFYGLIWSALLMTLLVLFAALAYPMHPQRLVLGTAFGMLAFMTYFAVTSLFAIERNRVHTLLRGRADAGIGFDITVITKLLTWLLPGLLVVSSYVFPGAIDAIMSAVGPFLLSAK